MSLHTWRRQGPCKPSSCTNFTLNSRWGRAATVQTKKKVLSLCTQGRFSPIQLFVTLWTAACQASLSGEFSRQEYWSILVNTVCHTLLVHLFPAALAANSPEYPVLPEPLRPKQLHHLHTWPSQGQTQVLQGSLGNKPQQTAL